MHEEPDLAGTDEAQFNTNRRRSPQFVHHRLKTRSCAMLVVCWPMRIVFPSSMHGDAQPRSSYKSIHNLAVIVSDSPVPRIWRRTLKVAWPALDRV
jgi:hypothetical protein